MGLFFDGGFECCTARVNLLRGMGCLVWDGWQDDLRRH